MFPIVCTSSSDIFLVISSLHWSFIWKHTKYQIYQLAMKTLLGLLGPSARHSFCPSIMLGIQIVRAGVQRGVGPHRFTIFPWEVEGCELFMSQMPKSLFYQLCSWVPLPLRGGRPLCLFPSLLGHQSTHSLGFSWWWGAGAKNEWAVETQTSENATLGLLVLLSHSLPRQ